MKNRGHSRLNLWPGLAPVAAFENVRFARVLTREQNQTRRCARPFGLLLVDLFIRVGKPLLSHPIKAKKFTLLFLAPLRFWDGDYGARPGRQRISSQRTFAGRGRKAQAPNGVLLAMAL